MPLQNTFLKKTLKKLADFQNKHKVWQMNGGIPQFLWTRALTPSYKYVIERELCIFIRLTSEVTTINSTITELYPITHLIMQKICRYKRISKICYRHCRQRQIIYSKTALSFVDKDDSVKTEKD